MRNPRMGSEQEYACESTPLGLRECLFGDRPFYREVVTVVLPIVVQNTLSNVVSLLDNIMVGQVGTLPMSAVAVVNQLMFIYYVCIWGGTAGAGIYGAQFFGSGDMEGVRVTLRLKLVLATLMTGLFFFIFTVFGQQLASLYIADGTSAADSAATLGFATEYLGVMLLGMIPFMITQCYAGTLRESGKTFLPMVASMSAMVVNFVFNLLLIFGLMGFPKLGVTGAAIATVISRFAELAIILIGAHRAHSAYPFIRGLYRSFVIPVKLLKPILMRSAPLLLNEFLWSLGESTLLAQYSVRGISVIAAMNINSTVATLFNEIFLSLGDGVAIIVGQRLGEGKLRDAVRTAWRVTTVSVLSCFGMGALLYLASPVIPQFYNTEPAIRAMATRLLIVSAIVMPLRGMTHCAYFTVRSGGKTWISLVLDSCFSWCVCIPLAFYIAHFTDLTIVPFYAIVAGSELIKCVIGFFLVRSRIWVKNIVS